jgi:Holliday junction resolvase-like predicted endonuclease
MLGGVCVLVVWVMGECLVDAFVYRRSTCMGCVDGFLPSFWGCTWFLCKFVQKLGGDGLSIERNLLISALKLTQKGPVKQELVYSDAHVPAAYGANLLQNLQSTTSLNLKDGLITADNQTRLTIAVAAAQKGADIEQISTHLAWQEFEAMAAMALQLNGYTTTNNLHFTQTGKRWEIDVVGCQKPLVVCIDCKHWRHGMHPSTMHKAAKTQAQRTHAFAQNLPNTKTKMDCTQWPKATFIPVILSLLPFAQKFCDQVPIVPVLSLQDFLGQLPLNLDCLVTFERQFEHLSHDF